MWRSAHLLITTLFNEAFPGTPIPVHKHAQTYNLAASVAILTLSLVENVTVSLWVPLDCNHLWSQRLCAEELSNQQARPGRGHHPGEWVYKMDNLTHKNEELLLFHLINTFSLVLLCFKISARLVVCVSLMLMIPPSRLHGGPSQTPSLVSWLRPRPPTPLPATHPSKTPSALICAYTLLQVRDSRVKHVFLHIQTLANMSVFTL